MKTPTNHIFQLIKAMSAAEKRYFKRHYSSNKNLLTELFDFINSLDEYNEEYIKTRFADSKLSKNLKVYKVQLSELLLKSLVSYHSKRNVRSKIRIGIEEMEILLEKKLYELAQGKLKKIKELCLQHEEYDQILSVLFLENRFRSFYSINPIQAQDTFLEEIEQFYERLRHILDLQKTAIQLNNQRNYPSPDRDIAQYRQWINQLYINYEQDQLSFTEKFYWYQSVAALYALLGEQENEWRIKREAVQIFINTPQLADSHSQFYFSTWHNYLSCCNSLKKLEELEEGIPILKAFVKGNTYLHRNLIFVYMLEVRLYFQQGKYRQIYQSLEPQINKLIKQYQLQNEYITTTLQLLLAVTHMILDHPPITQRYFRQFHNHAAFGQDPNMSQTCTLMEMISHYETQDEFIIQNMIQSFKRKMKGQHDFTPFFCDMIKLFHQLIKSDEDHRPLLAQEFIQQLDRYQQDETYIIAQQLLIDDWLVSTSQGQSFSKKVMLSVN
ncbi:MAG: hypothetical protein AAFP19_12105 [Bacteroidota bacterium]